MSSQSFQSSTPITTGLNEDVELDGLSLRSLCTSVNVSTQNHYSLYPPITTKL